jgi:hypothetical protein
MSQDQFYEFVDENNLESLKLLEYSSIDIHADDEYAFRWSCENGHLPIVKYLILLKEYRRIDIHANDEYAFREACENGHLEIVQFLLTLEPEYEQINIHADDEYAFRWSCYNGHLQIVKHLLSLEPEHGQTNIHANDDYAFRIACRYGHLPIVQFLPTLEKTHGPIDFHKVYEKSNHCCCFTILKIFKSRVNLSKSDLLMYQNGLELMIMRFKLLHCILIEFEQKRKTCMLDLNVLSIVKDFI